MNFSKLKNIILYSPNILFLIDEKDINTNTINSQDTVQENNIIIKIELLKSISKHCHNISIESDNNRSFSLYGWKISKYSTKFNIFMNLCKFLKELKNANYSLFDNLSVNICFIGKIICLFLNIYYFIIKNYHSLNIYKERIDFLLHEMIDFFELFYKYISNNPKYKDLGIGSFNLFFHIYVENFCRLLNSSNEKNIIYRKYNSFFEKVKFIIEKDKIEKKFNFRAPSGFSIEHLVKKVIKEIFKKLPEKSIEASNFFLNELNIINFYIEGNILMANHSEFIIPYLSNEYLLIKNQKYIQYLKNNKDKYVKNYIIKNIL